MVRDFFYSSLIQFLSERSVQTQNQPGLIKNEKKNLQRYYKKYIFANSYIMYQRKI